MSRVEEVLEKLGVEHRRQGNRVWARECPLPSHGAHNPQHEFQNWFIRPDRGAWSGFTCFSCKGSGNLVDLVMLLRGVAEERVAEVRAEVASGVPLRDVASRFPEYRDALAWVRGIGSAETEAPFLRVRVEPPRTPGVVEVPAGVEKMGAPYAAWNSVPRDYALSRGIEERQVASWRIGYALEGRLAGRLFLPIYDRRGRLANYAARDFVGAEKRYLAAGTWESPDTNVLFGEHRWPEPGFRETLLLFEGALNGLALERAAAGHAVEFGGMSGLDEREGGVDVRTLTKIATFRRVVTATDPDGPGERVAAAVARALRRRSLVVRLELPEGTDACDLPRDALAGRLAAALGTPAA